jgi:thiosulfate/3-mercaptopyruvate sulfurtransferase
MVSTNANALVTTAWLGDHLNAPDVRVVDASWHPPQSGRNGYEEYQSAHVPGAAFFDIDDIRDLDSDLPHMLPSAEKFSSRVRRMGLGDGNRIIVYDGAGCLSAARVWWMFRVFGHHDVAVLDGGFPKWRAEGRPVEDLPPHPRERHFTARLNTLMVRDLKQMKANVSSGREQVLDARSAGRFAGTEPEPRPGLAGGHIPGSTSIPYTALLDPAARTFLPAESLKEILRGHGIDLDRPIVTTCGSGVTAAIVSLALHAVGCGNTALYDGSWTEWVQHQDQTEAPTQG